MAFDFKKEEDVKEYLHNIGIEYRFGCYSEKKPEVCHLLGMYFHVIKKDSEQAKKVYKVNCDTYNWAYSCYQYAYLRETEHRNNPDAAIVDDMIAYYTKGCDHGLSKSCYLAGVRMGGKAEADDKMADRIAYFHKALSLVDRGCTEKVGEACFNMSSIYFNGVSQIGLKRDLRKVFEYAQKACDLGHINGCANLSLMYAKGEGTSKNIELARQYQQKTREIHKQMTEQGPKFEEGL